MTIAKELYLFVSFYERDLHATPNAKITFRMRNTQIRARYAQGEAISDLARDFDISPQRVFQIIRQA